ncbi:MAG: hypothetical protein ACO20H_03945 [Bacteriovoracaceae bacterium]
MGAKKESPQQNNEDKKLIADLIERINKILQEKDGVKKAAMIIKEWIDKK